MVKKPTRLRFTEEDLSDAKVQKAADHAEKAADKAEKAVDKLASKKSSAKLRQETSAGSSRKAKLRFEKAEITEIERPSVAKHMASRASMAAVTAKAHQAVSQYEDDNVGVQSAQETAKAVETTAYTVDHAAYSHKLKAYDKAEKLVKKSDKTNVDAHCMRSLRRIALMRILIFFPGGNRSRRLRKNTLPQKPAKIRQEVLLLQQKGQEKLQRVQNLSQKS